MKFAFIILGDFDAVRDRAEIRGGRARIWGVSSLAEACADGISACGNPLNEHRIDAHAQQD